MSDMTDERLALPDAPTGSMAIHDATPRNPIAAPGGGAWRTAPLDSPTPAGTGVLDLATIVDQASRFVTTEYASLTRAGAPVTWPVTPYAGTEGQTLDVATGLTYPLKAARARRDPRVALSFSFPVGSSLDPAPTYLVQGLATVRDADLRTTSARYLQASADRFPDMFARVPTFQLRRMDWYWTRMWVEVTPIRVRCWPGGDLDREPIVWAAPAGTIAPPSDPAPTGSGSGSWTPASVDWRARRAGLLDRLGVPVVTTVDDDGWPLPWRARRATETADGYVVTPPAGVEVRDGDAFVTFHGHAEVFDGNENAGFAARAEVRDGEVHLRIDRALSDFGVPRNPLRSALKMVTAGRRLRPRLATEAARRGTTIPTFADLDFRRPSRRG